MILYPEILFLNPNTFFFLDPFLFLYVVFYNLDYSVLS